MLAQKRKRHLLSVIVFLFLCVGTGVGFILLKNSQDNRQQASGTCKAGDPYCSCDAWNSNCVVVDPNSNRETVKKGSEENNKGILATSYTGERPDSKSACSHGVWMNEFCYMPGDEIAGGYIVVESGRHDYPYLEQTTVYESLSFGAETVTEKIGTTKSLGNNCDGKGQAYGGVCYAYGSVIDGYLVMPARTSGCNDSTGDYCYAHLEKIEVSYNDWQKAVEAYEKDGNTQVLENLYKKTYGISFSTGLLYDPKAPNAKLLKAQALLSALTSAEALKKSAQAENTELSKKASLTKEEQALYDFNKQIIDNPDLAKSYQLIDQLNDANAQQVTFNSAVSRMYMDLVEADSTADLNKLATSKFKEIFGYDPGSKYGDINGIIGAFGIDPTQLSQDRERYVESIVQAQVIAETNTEMAEKVEQEQELTEKIVSNPSDTSSNNLLALYELYIGHEPVYHMNANELKMEIAKYNPTLALSFFQTTQDVSILENYYKNNFNVSAGQLTTVLGDPKALLRSIYGAELGNQFYNNIVMPDRFNVAASSFANDDGAALKAVCKEMGVINCDFNGKNGTQTISSMLNKIYEGQTGVNIPELASNYSRSILAQSKETVKEATVDAADARTKYNMGYDPMAVAEYEAATGQKVDTSALADPLNEKEEILAIAVKATDIFGAYQNFDYVSQNSSFFSDYQVGLAYSEALMDDKVIDGKLDVQAMGLGAAEQFSLGFNKLAYQYANVTSTTTNVATNYASSKYYNYSGPADTNISDIALKGADNLNVFDTKNKDGTTNEYVYQAAQDGYYAAKNWQDLGETIGEAVTKAGAYYAATQMNQALANNSLYLDETYTYVDPAEYAKQAADEFKADYEKKSTDKLYEKYIATADSTEEDKQSYIDFANDPEVQRSSKELDYERLEKIVVPAVAIVTLPALVLSGAAPAIVLGMSSSAFSLYQGAGMKAQSLELQRIDIETRENAVVQSYIDNGATAEEIEKVKTDINVQVATLNKQGNLMLANSAVAAFTSVGGFLTSAGSAVQAVATTGQVLTKVGQVGGIAMNSYNAVNSGISSYNAFSNSKQIGDNKFWEGVMSATSSFVAASGVAGNTFGLVGGNTYTNKIDYILDAANVPAGAGLDLQQVAQACFGSSGAFTEQDCTNAWIGLALSAGQNVSQIASSRKNYLNDKAAGKFDTNTAQITDFQKQITAVDAEILALRAADSSFKVGSQINDLALQRAKLADQIAALNPNFKVAKLNTNTEDYLASSAKISLDLETKAQEAIDAGRNDEAVRLIEQADIYKNKPVEALALKDQIASIDEQVTKKGILLSNEEIADLQTKRSDLTNQLETVVKDLSAIESMQKQSAEFLQTAKENTALEELKKLQAVDTQKADLVKSYSPTTKVLDEYQAKLVTDNNAVKLETDSSERLKSIVALEDNLSKITDLETQKKQLLADLGTDSDQDVRNEVNSLDGEIARLKNQGVLNETETARVVDLENQRDSLSVGLTKIDAIDTEISGINKITEVFSADKRSFVQKVADAFSPNKAKNDAYYKSLDLTREAETIKNKLNSPNTTEAETQSLKEQLADVNRQILDQKYVLANDVANPSKNIIQRIAEIVPNIAVNRQISDLKNAAKKLGTSNSELAESITSKQAAVDKLKAESGADPAEITKLETELADLRKTAQNYLKGTNAIITVDQKGDHTRYVVADTEAGKKSGIKQKQLNILNDELAKFEDFKRQGQTAEQRAKRPWKIYSGTDSFKDQDIFLLAELESFGSGNRGSVFGALPGMGKTDVVMPFNILLKQRLTGEPQFVVFPESKLTKPWTTGGDNPVPNKEFIDYVEKNFGVGSVVIVKANDSSIDPAVIAKAKFVITTKDVAFDLQNTDTQIGATLRNKWRKSFIHADEVDWTFNPNENYKLSGTQVALKDKSEFGLYLGAQKSVLGLDENGNFTGNGLSSLRNLVNQLETSKSIPDGIVRTADGKGGKFADSDLEKQVLSEWLGTWNGQSKIAGLDMSADITTVRQKINNYLSTDTDAQTHNHRAELAMINETVNFLSRVPGEDYGLTTSTRMNGDAEESISSIAPREQNRETGRSYSAIAESLLYNTLGARVVGANGQVDLTKLTVGENGSEINYAALMLESKGFSLYTGTPETVAKIYKMAYGIELKAFTASAVDDSITRMKKSDSKVFTDLESQIAARLNEEKNQVFINMVAGVRSNEATLKDLITKVSTIDADNVMYERLMLVGASGKLTEYNLVNGELQYVRDFSSTDDLNARTTELDESKQLYIKFYEYGAHVGVDTANNVDISRAVGLCSGCDETTFAQGINRVRVDANTIVDGKSVVKSAPMDVVWLDAPADKTNAGIDDFATAINKQQTINEALAEVSFKETLLKNSVDSTIADLVDLAKNGKKGFLGFGAYKANQNLVAQLEVAQQKWKETSQMNYMLGSDSDTPQQKLEKTAAQVAGTYEELSKLVVGSGEPAKLLTKQADGAFGDETVKLAFSGDDDYKVLGEKPSYRQIVELINQSSKHLESVKGIAFTNHSSDPGVVKSEIAKAVDDVKDNTPVRTAEENANQNIFQRTSQAIVQAVNSPTVQRVIRTPVNLASSAFNAITGFFEAEEEIAPEVIASKDKAISDLKITDEQTLAGLENLRTTEEIANFVAERQAAYQKLKDQFATLNTVRPAVNNEEDYKASSDTLAETLATIQDLQDKSGLAFIAIADDGSISRVNEDQFANLSTFKAKAETQAEKLAKDTVLTTVDTIGRDPNNSLRTMSRSGNIADQHVQILRNDSNGNLYIRDLSTVNGTYVNGQKIETEKNILLHEGDTVLLGDANSSIGISFKVAKDSNSRLSLEVLNSNSILEKPITATLSELNNFDPVKGLDDLYKASRADRPAMIAKYKENLVLQKQGIASTQDLIISTIEKYPDTNIYKFTEEVKAYALNKGLNFEQIETIISSLRLYESKRQRADEILSLSDDPKVLFEKAFGGKPIGEVKIKRVGHQVVFYVKSVDAGRASNRNQSIPGGSSEGTFTRLIKNSFVFARNLAVDFFTGFGFTGFQASLTNIPNSVNQILVINSSYSDATESTLRHEFRHAIVGLLSETKVFGENVYSKVFLSKLSHAEDDGLSIVEFNQVVSEFLYEVRKNTENQFANEFIAQVVDSTKGKISIFKRLDLFLNLNFSHSYKHVARHKRYYESKSFYEYYLEDKDYIKSYLNLVNKYFGFKAQIALTNDAINSYNSLIDKGYSQEEAFATLQSVRVDHWMKNADRMPSLVNTNIVDETISNKEGENADDSEEEIRNAEKNTIVNLREEANNLTDVLGFFDSASNPEFISSLERVREINAELGDEGLSNEIRFYEKMASLSDKYAINLSILRLYADMNSLEALEEELDFYLAQLKAWGIDEVDGYSNLAEMFIRYSDGGTDLSEVMRNIVLKDHQQAAAKSQLSYFVTNADGQFLDVNGDVLELNDVSKDKLPVRKSAENGGYENYATFLRVAEAKSLDLKREGILSDVNYLLGASLDELSKQEELLKLLMEKGSEALADKMLQDDDLTWRIEELDKLNEKASNKTTARQSAIDFVDNWLSEHPVLANIKGTFPDFSPEMINENDSYLENHLKNKPAYNASILSSFFGGTYTTTEVEVDLDDIIGSEALLRTEMPKANNWWDVLIHSEKAHIYASMALENSLEQATDGIGLVDVGNGKYAVTNDGNTRVAILKALGVKKAKLKVNKYDLLKEHLIRESDLEILTERKNQGLWAGEIYQRDGNYFARVDSYTNPWVFLAGWETLRDDFNVDVSNVEKNTDLSVGQINTPQQALELVKDNFNSSEELFSNYLESAVALGAAQKNSDGTYEVDKNKLSHLPWSANWNFLNYVRKVLPKSTHMINNYKQMMANSENFNYEQQQIFINNLLDPTAKIFFDKDGNPASFEGYLKSVYGKMVEIIRVETRMLTQEEISETAKLIIGDEPRREFLEMVGRADVTTIVVKNGDKEIAIPIISSNLTNSDWAGSAVVKLSTDLYMHPVFINNLLKDRSLLETLSTVAHETDHIIHDLLNFDSSIYKTIAEDMSNAEVPLYFDSSNYESNVNKSLYERYLENEQIRHKKQVNETEKIDEIISEMGGDYASVRFLKAVANGISKSDYAGASIAQDLIENLVSKKILHRIELIGTDSSQYAVGIMLGHVLEQKYGSDEFFRILNGIPLIEARVLLKDAIKEAEKMLEDQSYPITDIFEKIYKANGPVNISLEGIKNNEYLETDDPVSVVEKVRGAFINSVEQIKIFNEVSKIETNNRNKMFTSTKRLHQIVSYLADENIPFRNYVKSRPQQNESNEEAFAEFTPHIDMLFNVFHNELTEEIFSSEEVRRTVFDIAYHRASKKVGELEVYSTELENLINSLDNPKTEDFDRYTGLSFELPTTFDEQKGQEVINLSEFESLKKKIQLISKYQEPLSKETIKVDLSGNTSFEEAEELFKKALEAADLIYEPIQTSSSNSFNSLCSDCNQVRLDTQAGVEIVDSLTKEAEELAKQADAARVVNNQDQAADLSNQAQAKQQEALDQLNNTRFQVANSHGMQNQCVQLYLNAWVDTREAAIRNTQADVDKAINSVYQATVIAEDLLASEAMEITTKNGFLGIGQQKETITLSPEEITDVTNLLEGNAEENIIGLKEMAQFEQTDGQLDKIKVAGGILGQLKNSAQKKSLLPSIKDKTRVFGRSVGASLKKSFVREATQQEINNAERTNLFNDTGVKISNFFYNTFFKEKVEESLDLLTSYGSSPTPNQKKHAWLILNLFGNNSTAVTLIESIHYAKLAGDDLVNAWKIIEQKGDVNTATVLAEQIRYGYLIGDNSTKALKVIEQKGDANTAISLINAISNVRFSNDSLVNALNFITRDDIGNTAVATALVSTISNDLFTGDNLAKVWTVIEQKGDAETAIALTTAIVNGRLTGENFSTAFNFVTRDDIANASVATALANIIYLGRLTGDDLEKTLKVIEQKGDTETAISLTTAIVNGRLDGENLSAALNFVTRDDIGNASVATALTTAIVNGRLDGENLFAALNFATRDDIANASVATALVSTISNDLFTGDNLAKVWTVIEQKGDARTATFLANAIPRSRLAGDNLAKAWTVIDQKGDTETAIALTTAIVNGYLTDENFSTAFNFATRDDIANASVATALANIIYSGRFTDDNLKKALEIIEQKGDVGTATALINAIYSDHLIGENLSATLNFLTRDNIANASIATALANIIYSGRFTDDNLKKILKVIDQKGDANTATALVNAIYSGYLTGEDLSTSLNIAYEKGDANTAMALVYTIFNGHVADENLTTALNFVIENDVGDTSIATDLANAISNGRLVGANLTNTLNFVTTRNDISNNASIGKNLANAISNGHLVGKELTTALNFVTRDDIINTSITLDLANSIYLGRLTGDDLEKALKIIEQKGDVDTATALVNAIHSGHLIGNNLEKTLKIIEQKGNANTATALVKAIYSGYLVGDNLAKAWKVIEQKGNVGTATVLANAFLDGHFIGENLTNALNFVTRNDIGNDSIVKIFTHAVSSGNLAGDNLAIVLNYVNKNNIKNTSVTNSEKNISEFNLNDINNIESLHQKINNGVTDMNTELEYISNVLSQKNITVDNKGMFFSKVVLLVFGDNIPSRLQAPAKLTAWRVYSEVQKGEEITSQKLLNLIYRAKDAIQQQLNEVSDDSLSNVPVGYRVSIGNEIEVVNNGLSRTGLFNLNDYIEYKRLFNQLKSAGASSAQIIQDQIAIYEAEFTDDSLNQAKDAYKEVAKELSDLGIGRGSDGTHEFANYPVSDYSALIWEYSELERLGFLSLNPQILQWIGERGIHITISGEQGIKFDDNAILLQNSLLMTGYTSAVLNGQAGIQDAEEKSATTTDISGKKVSTEYSIARGEYLRFRPSIADVFTNKAVSGVEFRVNSISSLQNLQKTLRAYGRLSIPLMTYQNALSNKEFDEKTLLEDMNNIIDDPTLFKSIILNNEENKFLLPTVEDPLKRKMILTWAYYRAKSIFNFEKYQISNLLPSPINPLVSKTLKVMDGELGKVFPTTEEGTSRLLDDAFASFHHSPPPNSLPGQMQNLVDEVLNGIDSLPEFKSEAGTVAYSNEILSIQGLNSCSSCSLRTNTVLNQLGKANEFLTKGNVDEAINIIDQARNYANSHQYKNTLVQDIQNKDVEVEEVNIVKTKAEQDDALKVIQLIINRVNDLLKTRKDLTPEQITALNTFETELETEKATVASIQVKPSSLLEYLQVNKQNISSAFRRLTYAFNSGSRQAEDEKLEQNYRLTYPLQVKINKGAEDFNFDDETNQKSLLLSIKDNVIIFSRSVGNSLKKFFSKDVSQLKNGSSSDPDQSVKTDNLVEDTEVNKVLNLGATNFLITKLGIGINKLPVGQIIEDEGLFYKVVRQNDKNILVNVLPFRQNLRTYQKTIDKYNKEKDPKQITLANNLRISVYWNEEKSSIFVKTNNSEKSFELNEKGLVFDNGIILRIINGDQLDIEWLTEEIKIATSQSLIIKDGKIYFSNKEYYDEPESQAAFLGFQINGKFYGDYGQQVELAVGDEIITHDGSNYILNKDSNGFYSLDSVDVWEKVQLATTDLTNKIKNFKDSAILRTEFLLSLNKDLELGKSAEEISSLSNDSDAYFEYVNNVFGLSKWYGLQHLSSFRITQNPKEFELAETKLKYMIFKFYDGDDELTSILRNIEKIAIENSLPRLKYSANVLRHRLEVSSKVEQLSLISYLKNLEKLISVYESYLNESRDETELKINELISVFENSFGEKINQELEKNKRFNPYDQNTYFKNVSWNFPFSDKLELERKIDLVSDGLQEFLTKKLFEQITDETGQDAFVAHQTKALAFWDLYFSEMGTQKPEWFKPGIYEDKENYGYVWQHSFSEHTLANAAGTFFLKGILALDKDSLEKVIDHESIHNTFVPESAPRKHKDGFNHEEIVTELLAQMMYLQTLNLPSKNYGFSSYQPGVNELIDILNEINERSGDKLGQNLLLKGIVDYGENKIAHPLVYVAEQYNNYESTANNDFYQRLTPYTNDIMRGNHDNLPEQSFVMGRLNSEGFFTHNLVSTDSIESESINKLNFSSLCSDCNQVRLDTQAGVMAADSLVQEANDLTKQAEEAKNANDQAKAAELEKQAQAKQQEALDQLNKTRFQVINSHGMQNQCVQLYLNAWVDTREAMIRKTRAYVDQAIDSVYEATVLAEEMMNSKQMAIKTGAILGFGGKTTYKPLSSEEVEDIGDLLFGNKAKNIEGLQSWAAFDVGADGKFSRTILKGSLLALENTVVADQISPIIIALREFAKSSRQRILDNTIGLSLSLDQIIEEEQADEPLVSITISPISVSPTLTSPTPSSSVSPTPEVSPSVLTPTPTPTKPTINWRSIWQLIRTLLSPTLFGSIILQYPIIPNWADLGEEISQESGLEEPLITPSPTPEPVAVEEVAPKTEDTPAADKDVEEEIQVEKPIEIAVRKPKSIVLDTAIPQQVINPYALYEITSDGKALFPYRDEWVPVDPSILPSYSTNRNPSDYLKTIEFFQVEESMRYRRESSVTFCNIYVSDVTKALGVPIPRWMNGEKVTADGVYNLLQSSFAKEELGWKEVSAQEAQSLANQGIPTVAAIPKYEVGDGAVVRGHVAMIIPGEGENYEGVFYPSSAQAGNLNFDDGSSTRIGFAGAINNNQEVKYFTNESQYEFTQSNPNIES